MVIGGLICSCGYRIARLVGWLIGFVVVVGFELA